MPSSASTVPRKLAYNPVEMSAITFAPYQSALYYTIEWGRNPLFLDSWFKILKSKELIAFWYPHF